MTDSIKMLPFRAKIKVRYAMLLVAFLSVLCYTVVKSGICCGEVFRKSQDFEHDDNVIADVIRRSLNDKWHDSRELLNKKTKTYRQKEARPIPEIKWGDIGRDGKNFLKKDLDTREKTMQIDFNFVDLPDEEKETFKQNEVENLINTKKIITKHKSESTTTSELLHKKNFMKNRNTESESQDVADTVDEEQWEFPVDEDANGYLRNDKTLEEITKKRNSTKALWELGLNLSNNETEQSESDDKGEEYYNNIENNDYNPEDNDMQVSEDDDITEGDDDADDDDIQSSNLTIFDPAESEMTYYIRENDKLFARSQINKSRTDDKPWANGFPLTPEEVIIRYGQLLPPWEQYEIFHYTKIYYFGLWANKTQLTHNVTNNFGFDHDAGTDREGHYKVVVGDHIGYRYEIIKYLGSGTFGGVVLARDWSNPSARNVAIKLMHLDENEKYFMREVRLMKLIENFGSNHDYFSRMIASFKFRNHWCIVLELLGHSVDRHFLESPIRNMSLLRQFADDILHAMFYLKELNIVHGDLKPDNIMFIHGKNNKSEGQLLKVADFGIGCIPKNDEYHCPSYYIQTRYYRAPEVILSLPVTTQVDMFSVGVILGEFYLGVPPFFGETETDQLAAMMEVLGLPPTYMIANSPRKKIYQKAICYETENGFHRKPYRKPLTKVLKGMDPILFDLISRCLEFDPKLRITPAEALRHPFITGVRPLATLPEPMLIKRLLGKI